jgi:hypothetical protein
MTPSALDSTRILGLVTQTLDDTATGDREKILRFTRIDQNTAEDLCIQALGRATTSPV